MNNNACNKGNFINNLSGQTREYLPGMPLRVDYKLLVLIENDPVPESAHLNVMSVAMLFYKDRFGGHSLKMQGRAVRRDQWLPFIENRSQVPSCGCQMAA